MNHFNISEEIKNSRKTEYPINSLILGRWSPRALSGEALSNDELMTLFEAARWAPSSNNNQEWLFLYAKRETPQWDDFFGFLNEKNQSWAKNAGVLIVVLSKKISDYNGKPIKTHSFDTGASWQNLALQATSMGLVAHAMAGFDYDKTKSVLNIPDDYEVECMVAVGKRGKKEDLPAALQEREFPSTRKLVGEISREGKFKE